MNKVFTLLAAFLAATSTFAQAPCSDLFISEYVVGSGNNRALELYNPTSLPIDLSNYQVGRFRNGSGTPMLLPLSGTILPNDVYVIAHDKRDPNGTGFEEPIDPALEAVADTFVNPVFVAANSPFYFNGDDAVVLTNQSGTLLVDLFGKIGEDPGTAWSDANGTWWTVDKTLVRKPTVLSGVTQNPSQFVVETEWDSLPVNTFSELGFHSCDCANFCPPTFSTTTVSQCGSYTWNGQTYNQSGTYTFQTSNSQGCDSIATLELTINPNIQVSESYVLCDGQSITVGGVTYSQEGQFTQLIPGAGCDTVLTLNVTEELAPSVSILGNTQISGNTTETYAIVEPSGFDISWSATNGTILSGQGTISSTVFWDATGGGIVSVTLSNGNCSYTEDLAVGSLVGIDGAVNNTNVFPNPSNGIFHFEDLDKYLVRVFSAQGRLIQESSEVGPFTIDLTNQSHGSYMVQLQNEKTITHLRLLKY